MVERGAPNQPDIREMKAYKAASYAAQFVTLYRGLGM